MADGDVPAVATALSHLGLESNKADLCMQVESPDVTRIETREDLGRVVVAAQAATVGSRIIREKPAIVWKSGNWFDFFEKYQSELTQDVRDGILDMHHPPLDSAQMQKLQRTASVIASRVSMNESLVHKLLGICNTNAHEYFGHQNQSFSEILSMSERLSSGRAALFLYASKVAHSCNPNTSYSSSTSDGLLEYKALVPIAEGDMVSFSYLDKIWDTPTHVRREKLTESKSFFCQCNRCMGPDYSRLVRCPKCCKSVPARYDSKERVEWFCVSCELVLDGDSMHRKETKTQQKLDALNEMMMINVTSCLPAELEREIKESSTQLHPLHFLTLRAMELYIRLCATHANSLEQPGIPPMAMRAIRQRFGTPAKLRRQAAEMGIARVLACECIAAKSMHGSCSCETSTPFMQAPTHAPVYDQVQQMFHVSQDLMRCPEASWPAHTRTMVHRYIPLMRLQYGEHDSDVGEIESKIPAPSRSDASASASSCKKKGVGTNKKKGGKTNKKKGGKRR